MTQPVSDENCVSLDILLRAMMMMREEVRSQPDEPVFLLFPKTQNRYSRLVPTHFLRSLAAFADLDRHRLLALFIHVHESARAPKFPTLFRVCSFVDVPISQPDRGEASI